MAVGANRGLRATRWPLPPTPRPPTPWFARKGPTRFVDGSNHQRLGRRDADRLPLHPSPTSGVHTEEAAKRGRLRSGARPEARSPFKMRPLFVFFRRRACGHPGFGYRWGVPACRHRHRPIRSGRRSTPSPMAWWTDAGSKRRAMAPGSRSDMPMARWSLYGHVNTWAGEARASGVMAGDQIATHRQTAATSTGPHCHFSILRKRHRLHRPGPVVWRSGGSAPGKYVG